MRGQSLIKDQTTFIIVRQYSTGEINTQEHSAFLSKDEVIAYMKEVFDDLGDDVFQIIELNPIEGYSRDVSEDFALAMEGTEDFEYNFEDGVICCEAVVADPDDLRPHDERLGCHSQGVGRFGQFGA